MAKFCGCKFCLAIEESFDKWLSEQPISRRYSSNKALLEESGIKETDAYNIFSRGWTRGQGTENQLPEALLSGDNLRRSWR